MAFDDPFSRGVVDAEGGDGDFAAVDEGRGAGHADEAAPGAGADDGAEAGLAEEPREAVAARAAPAVGEDGFGAAVGDGGRLPFLAVADGPVVRHFSPEELDEAVGDLAAGVPAFVDDERRF